MTANIPPIGNQQLRVIPPQVKVTMHEEIQAKIQTPSFSNRRAETAVNEFNNMKHRLNKKYYVRSHVISPLALPKSHSCGDFRPGTGATCSSFSDVSSLFSANDSQYSLSSHRSNSTRNSSRKGGLSSSPHSNSFSSLPSLHLPSAVLFDEASMVKSPTLFPKFRVPPKPKDFQSNLAKGKSFPVTIFPPELRETPISTTFVAVTRMGQDCLTRGDVLQLASMIRVKGEFVRAEGF